MLKTVISMLMKGMKYIGILCIFNGHVACLHRVNHVFLFHIRVMLYQIYIFYKSLSNLYRLFLKLFLLDQWKLKDIKYMYIQYYLVNRYFSQVKI